ncbi:hypothetical protein [Acinetobacter soli]|uniref:hypothetical protein n=1 Tax=Acinetobacter soli TaxID=487316 RepID=UPI00148F34F3|nr:hypothetical protein [Acinetobacter soli]
MHSTTHLFLSVAALWRVFFRKKESKWLVTTHPVATLFCHYTFSTIKKSAVLELIVVGVSLQRHILKKLCFLIFFARYVSKFINRRVGLKGWIGWEFHIKNAAHRAAFKA